MTKSFVNRIVSRPMQGCLGDSGDYMKIAAATLLSVTLAMPGVAAAQTTVPVVAQPALVLPIVAVARPLATDAQAALPANSEIWVSPNAEVNSKRIKQGDKFDMSVSRDVMLGNYVVIPRGTRAVGQISYRTGKGSFGKSGKMEFEVVDVDLGGRLIPVKGHYRIEGNGNTGATVGAVVAVGVFAAFVTGHSASVAQGTEYKAYTTDALPIVTAAPPAYASAAPIAPVALPAALPPTAVPIAVPAAAAPTAAVVKISSPPQR